MTRICFVTEELHPVTPGGAGVLIHNSFLELSARGHEVSFLLDVDRPAYERARDLYRSPKEGPRAANVWHVDEIVPRSAIPSEAALGGAYLWRSYRFFVALGKVLASSPVDLVEFNDFFGPAYFSLVGKAASLGLAGTTLAVRVHNPFEALFVAGDASAMRQYVLDIFAIERASLRLAEHRLVPSDAYWTSTGHLYWSALLGETHVSTPVLRTWPAPVHEPAGDAARIVLFLGRLWPFKGLDRFVSAMVTVAHQCPSVRFVLAGADSTISLDGSASYGEQLRRSIPPELRPRFDFRGHLSPGAIAELLPQVCCAVFPNYFESFCYASHELYEAGVPLVVTDTPAFAQFFRHEENALVARGTIEDLARQTARLIEDPALRQRIRPARLAREEPLGPFYDRPGRGYLDAAADFPLSTAVLVLDLGGRDGAELCARLSPVLGPEDRIARLSLEPAGPSHSPLTFLGAAYYLRGADGEPLAPWELRTCESLLVLQAGDVPDPELLPALRGTLAAHPELSFARSWRTIQANDGSSADDFRPIELALGELLFQPQPQVSRTLVRTAPGRRLDDVFDIRAGRLGEIDYLWRLADERPGITVPRNLLACVAEPVFLPVEATPALCAYLLSKDGNADRVRAAALRALLPAEASPVVDRAEADASDMMRVAVARSLGGRKLLRLALAKLARRLAR